MYGTMLLLHILAATIWTGGHLVLALTVLPRVMRERSPSKLLEFVFDIPAADWPDDAPVLEIEANGWVPAERGNSRDHRRLGIMLLDVEARRS